MYCHVSSSTPSPAKKQKQKNILYLFKYHSKLASVHDAQLLQVYKHAVHQL